MLVVARRHRPSLMKYFCSQSSNRGYSPSTSLALILLSSLCLFSLSSCNSSRPSGLSSLSVLSVYLILPPFTSSSSVHLCSSPSILTFLYIFLGAASHSLFINTPSVSSLLNTPGCLSIQPGCFHYDLISVPLWWKYLFNWPCRESDTHKGSNTQVLTTPSKTAALQFWLSMLYLNTQASHLNVINSNMTHNGSLRGQLAPQRGIGVPHPWPRTPG